MKKYFKLLLVLSISSTYLISKDIKNNIEAINIAGKQRMLTQKILKEYAMIGMNNKFGEPILSLKESVNDFDIALKSLSKFNKDKKCKKELSSTKILWLKTKKIVEDKPSLDNATKLQNILDKLLSNSDRITKIFIKNSKSKSVEIINIAGKERMYSQKLASLYMLKVWGIKDKQFDIKMEETIKSFKESLNKLEKYPKNTDAINKLIKSTKKAFLFFDIMSKSKSKFIPSLIYKKSLEILNNMDTIVSLYAKIEHK